MVLQELTSMSCPPEEDIRFSVTITASFLRGRALLDKMPLLVEKRLCWDVDMPMVKSRLRYGCPCHDSNGCRLESQVACRMNQDRILDPNVSAQLLHSVSKKIRHLQDSDPTANIQLIQLVAYIDSHYSFLFTPVLMKEMASVEAPFDLDIWDVGESRNEEDVWITASYSLQIQVAERPNEYTCRSVWNSSELDDVIQKALDAKSHLLSLSSKASAVLCECVCNSNIEPPFLFPPHFLHLLADLNASLKVVWLPSGN